MVRRAQPAQRAADRTVNIWADLRLLAAAWTGDVEGTDMVSLRKLCDLFCRFFRRRRRRVDDQNRPAGVNSGGVCLLGPAGRRTEGYDHRRIAFEDVANRALLVSAAVGQRRKRIAIGDDTVL